LILYHFTKPKFLPAIRKQGIVPRAAPHTADNWDAAEGEHLARRMTPGRPVVWLTTIPDEWIGVRLDVRLEPNSSRLKQWAPWARRHGMMDLDRVALDAMLREGNGRDMTKDILQWFLYFGTIAPTRIIAGLKHKTA
jgi:hypothetical protein